MSELSLLDTNILVYAVDSSYDYHASSKSLRDRALIGETSCCLCPQVLLELFATVTNPRRVSRAISPIDAMKEIERYLKASAIRFIYPPLNVLEILKELLIRYPVKSQEIFDLNLAATMLSNGVKRIYTFDDAVFGRFSEITVLRP